MKKKIRLSVCCSHNVKFDLTSLSSVLKREGNGTGKLIGVIFSGC